jgi:DNA-nicking Smr family endonuclease
MCDDSDNFDAFEDAVALTIDGVLDLHTFSPKEIKDLVPDYIEECRVRNILEIRIIHGKGIGVLKKIVYSILDKHPQVSSFRPAGPASGGWGAVEVNLKPIVLDDGTRG